MNIKEIKRTLNIGDAEIGEMFGYKNYSSYYNAARRKHIENGIIKLYEIIKHGYPPKHCDADGDIKDENN